MVGIKIDHGKTLWFSTLNKAGATLAPIEGLKLSKVGILKQFPDLKDLEFGDMRREAILRLKRKVKSLDTTEDITTYLRNELGKDGYKLTHRRRDGFRPEKMQ